MGNAGRVLMIPKGDYNAATTYERLDFVYYQGRSYVCKQTSTGNAPTNTTYWQALTGDASAEIQALTNYVAENNVKNILHETITTRTVGGVTFTVNSDGSITLEGTCNETASVNIAEYFPIKAGDYVYSKGATTGSAIMYLYDTATFADIAYTADHVEFSIASDRQIMARFYIVNGTTYNATVYPMIVAKSVYDADPTYQPYAKTNVELTQDVDALNALKIKRYSIGNNNNTDLVNAITNNGQGKLIFIKRNDSSDASIAVYYVVKTSDGVIVCPLHTNNTVTVSITVTSGIVNIANTSGAYVFASVIDT